MFYHYKTSIGITKPRKLHDVLGPTVFRISRKETEAALFNHINQARYSVSETASISPGRCLSAAYQV